MDECLCMAKWQDEIKIYDGMPEYILSPERYNFVLYERNGDEKSREEIEQYKDWLKSCSCTREGVFENTGEQRRKIPWNELYRIYTFYMEYETKYHNKAEYGIIVEQLRMLKVPDEHWTTELGWYLMTLIDVMDHMSQEIFEHYKSLEEIFKTTIRTVLKENWKANFESKECAMVGYAVVKACRLHVLNSEKYAQVGLSMIDGMIDELNGTNDTEMTGVVMMAYAESMNFKMN